MVEVSIHHTHQAVIWEEPNLFGNTQWRLACACGWAEKGYGQRDCEEKALDHARKAPDVLLSLPVTMQGRRRWPASS